MSIGVGEFEVSILYKIKGIIDNIYFEIKEDSKISDLKEITVSFIMTNGSLVA
ncbi:hypothetical protein [Bacillus sp. AFS017336]|uniref:hypothetical protein n=1 Tax=Bacillus sp. AFS017336 TaxID=2033489 RepID=UPI0015CF7C6F|nr:hypothetical protein [Bacillus sp. AFS017336]